jgi:hypothetical protein
MGVKVPIDVTRIMGQIMQAVRPKTTIVLNRCIKAFLRGVKQ